MQITVDGDTSTNDTVLGLASGKAGGEVISDPKSPEAKELDAAVTALLQVGYSYPIFCQYIKGPPPPSTLPPAPAPGAGR